MGGSRVNKACKTQLFDPSQTLQIWMFQQVEYKIRWNDDKTVNRIIDYFAFVGEHGNKLLNNLPKNHTIIKVNEPVFCSLNYYVYLCTEFYRLGDDSPLFCCNIRPMINAESIRSFLQDELGPKGLFLVDVVVRPGNKILVYLDSMKGVTLDECMAVSRFLESRFDRNIEDFELEVSSPGLDRPLKLPVQFEKNIGRLLDVVKTDGIRLTGKLLGINADIIELETEVTVKDSKTGRKKKELKQIAVEFEKIKTAKVVISLKSNLKNGKP